MAEDKRRDELETPDGTEAEIMQFREHLGIHDQQEDPLFGKVEQALNAFSEIESEDLLDALNSISKDDEE